MLLLLLWKSRCVLPDCSPQMYTLRCRIMIANLARTRDDAKAIEDQQCRCRHLVEDMELMCGVCGEGMGEAPEGLDTLPCCHLIHARRVRTEPSGHHTRTASATSIATSIASARHVLSMIEQDFYTLGSPWIILCSMAGNSTNHYAHFRRQSASSSMIYRPLVYTNICIVHYRLRLLTY